MKLLGIDIGGTKIAVAVGTTDGAVLAERRFPTGAERGPWPIVAEIVACGRALLRGDPPAAVGVSCGGPLDTRAGLVLSPPNLPGWDRVPLAHLLSEAFRAPAALENDANAAALAEHRLGAGRGASSLLYVTVSTGVGAGVVLDGRLWRGVGGAAGEVGHQTVLPTGPACPCGNEGCLEALASGTAIARTARARLKGDPRGLLWELVDGQLHRVSARLVADAARAGDPLAREVWDEAVAYLAVGLANVITTLAPAVVVVGGGVAEAGDLLFTPLREGVKRRARLVPVDEIPIVPAALGGSAGVVGALLVAAERAGGGAPHGSIVEAAGR